MNKHKRNIIIFSILSMGGGFLGMFIDRLDPPADRMQGLGSLVWLITPWSPTCCCARWAAMAGRTSALSLISKIAGAGTWPAIILRKAGANGAGIPTAKTVFAACGFFPSE